MRLAAQDGLDKHFGFLGECYPSHHNLFSRWHSKSGLPSPFSGIFPASIASCSPLFSRLETTEKESIMDQPIEYVLAEAKRISGASPTPRFMASTSWAPHRRSASTAMAEGILLQTGRHARQPSAGRAIRRSVRRRLPPSPHRHGWLRTGKPPAMASRSRLRAAGRLPGKRAVAFDELRNGRFIAGLAEWGEKRSQAMHGSFHEAFLLCPRGNCCRLRFKSWSPRPGRSSGVLWRCPLPNT